MIVALKNFKYDRNYATNLRRCCTVILQRKFGLTNLPTKTAVAPNLKLVVLKSCKYAFNYGTH